MAVTTAQVQELYVAFLGRAADKAGLDYWMAELNAEPAVLTLENLRANFVNEQPEYAQNYDGLTREEAINKMYANLFGRAPEAAGLEYWAAGGGKEVNMDQLLVALVNGALGADAQTLTNKVLVADVYTKVVGDKYVQADAKAILAGVDEDYTSVGTALDKLTDGSLSGIAVPAAVTAINALISADKAVADYAASKLAAVKALDKAILDLDKADANINVTVKTASGNTAFADILKDVKDNLADARGDLVGSTAELTTISNADGSAATTAYNKFLSGITNATTLATNYRTADTRFDAAKAVGEVSVDDSTAAGDSLDSWAAVSGNVTSWNNAVKAAGLDPATEDGASIYAMLTSVSTTPAVYTKVVDALKGISAASELLKLAAQQREYNVADEGFKKASDAITSADSAASKTVGVDWVAAYEKAQASASDLASSKALDALEAQYKVLNDGHVALTDAQVKASGAVNDLVTAGSIKDVSGLTLTAVADKAEVFYFADGVKATDATALDKLESVDKIFLGGEYSFNNGSLSDGNNNVLEFFLVGKGNDTQLVIETAKYGSDAAGVNVAADGTITEATGTADQLAVITLTGVTVDQISFANGVLSFA
ncbi:DUF4214 domain-containing protein [Stutzerimonas stutzeri]|uniref:DUF4214 domain-containing protein n=1 Tax=Stutzerimonas stutzeri TaxID=316 RepID=UPI0018AAC168|nr:DUF4214 domain-containing protein [Stutzerimonas stutzeri]QPI09206.1 DUF4214 domain-containing protein [Stutzerimonas stutzeri]